MTVQEGLAKARVALDEFDAPLAIDILNGVLQQDPQNADAHAEFGLALCYSQKELDAVPLLSKAVSGRRFEQLAKLLSDHLQARRMLAEKLQIEDKVGMEALALAEPYLVPSQAGVTLTACLIVKNEEANLPRCLKSLEGLADQVVVIDTGSTDATIAIAREFGATIGAYEWNDDFAAARNESLRLATGHWILWIDADEEVSKNSHQAIREGLIRPHFGGYFIQIVNFMSDDSDANQYVHTPVRLFQNFEGVRFDGRIHEQVLPSMREANLVCATLGSATINHYGYTPSAMTAKDKLKRTLDLLTREVEEHPEDAFQWFNLANAYSVGRMKQEAAEAARRAAYLMEGDAPYGPVTYQILSSALIALGQPNDALQVCDEADERGFGAITVQFERAHAFYRLREFNAALIAIDRCLAMDWPDGLTGDYGIKTHKGLVLKGQILTSLGRYNEAEACLVQALKVDDTFPLALFAYAFLLDRKGQFENAITLFRQCGTDPDLGEPSLRICGHIAVKQGQLDAAKQAFEQAWSQYPDSVESWLGLVQVLEALGETAQLLALYSEFDRLHTMSADLLVNWGRELLRAGQKDEAARAFQRAVESDPSNANAHFNLGDLAYANEMYLEAATAYEQGLQQTPQHAEGWFVLGNALAMLGSLDGAKLGYEQVLRLQPDHTGAKHNLDTIQAA